MFGLGIGEIFLILVFALIFIGPKKLPELAQNLGKSLREFQKAKDDLMAQVHTETHDAQNHSQVDHHSALTDDTLHLQEDESIVAAETMDVKAEPMTEPREEKEEKEETREKPKEGKDS